MDLSLSGEDSPDEDSEESLRSVDLDRLRRCLRSDFQVTSLLGISSVRDVRDLPGEGEEITGTGKGLHSRVLWFDFFPGGSSGLSVIVGPFGLVWSLLRVTSDFPVDPRDRTLFPSTSDMPLLTWPTVPPGLANL